MKTVLVAACVLMLLVSAHAQTPALAITHVTVIDVENGAAQPDMTVVIDGNTIRRIAKSGSVRIPRSATVIDGRGKFLIPGLWDMHVHFTEVDRTFPMFIANGVTGVRNVGGDLQQLLRWRAAVDSGQLLGPQIVTCGPIVDGPEPAAHGPVVIAGNQQQGKAVVDKLKQEGADCIKVYDRLPREAYFAIIDEARRKQIPVVGHVPLALTSEEAANAGQRSIEHLGNILESASSLGARLFDQDGGPVKDPSEFPRRLAARGERMLATYDTTKAAQIFAAFVKNKTWQVPTLETKWTLTFFDDLNQRGDERLKYIPAAERQWWTPEKNFFARYRTPEYIVYRKKLFEKELQLVRDMRRAGVEFMTGTDLSGAYIFAGFSLHHEMELLVTAGLTPLEALQAATLNPAKFLGQDKIAGTVSPGKRADLVLLEANPVKDIRNTKRINAVILNGQYLSKEKLKTLLDGAEAAAK